MARELSARIARVTRDPDYATLLTALATEYALSEDQIKQVFKTIDLESLDLNLGFLRVMHEVSKYQGFNPRDIISQLFNMHSRTRKDIIADPSLRKTLEIMVTIQGQRAIFSNNMEFHEDMKFICLMFITRGTAFDKIQTKSTSEVMNKCMGMMKTKYNIHTVKRRPSSQLDARTITIPRIAASFPSVIVELYVNGFGRNIFDPSEIFGDLPLPKALMAPMISSCLPKTEGAPLAVMMAIAVKTDDVLYQMDTKTSLSALYQYFMASYNSTAVTETVKMKHCVKWELGTRPANGTFIYTGVLVDLKPRAREFIERSRSTDPYLRTLLAQI